MGRAVRIIHSFFFWFFVLLVFLLYAPYLWLKSLSRRKPEEIFLSGARNFSSLMVWFSCCPVKIKGRENLPSQAGYIIVANHQSAFDIFLLLAVLPPNFYFMVKDELYRVPLLGWFLRKAGYISIARTNALAASRALQRTIALLEKGRNILIFPEGTRSHAHQIGPFKRGVGEMIASTKAPVLPVVLDGSYKVMPRDSRLIQPAEITVTIAPAKIFPPVPAGVSRANVSCTTQRFMNELREEFVRILG